MRAAVRLQQKNLLLSCDLKWSHIYEFICQSFNSDTGLPTNHRYLLFLMVSLPCCFAEMQEEFVAVQSQLSCWISFPQLQNVPDRGAPLPSEVSSQRAVPVEFSWTALIRTAVKVNTLFVLKRSKGEG